MKDRWIGLVISIAGSVIWLMGIGVGAIIFRPSKETVDEPNITENGYYLETYAQPVNPINDDVDYRIRWLDNGELRETWCVTETGRDNMWRFLDVWGIAEVER